MQSSLGDTEVTEAFKYLNTKGLSNDDINPPTTGLEEHYWSQASDYPVKYF